jgi:hypothetical protein
MSNVENPMSKESQKGERRMFNQARVGVASGTALVRPLAIWNFFQHGIFEVRLLQILLLQKRRASPTAKYLIYCLLASGCCLLFTTFISLHFPRPACV